MLKHFTSITVPSTQGLDTPLRRSYFENRMEMVAREMTVKFGRCTVTYGTGYYRADNEDIVEEPVAVVTSYHNGESRDITSMVERYCGLWGQECVAVTTECGMEFVEV